MSSPAAGTPGPSADVVALFVGALAGDRAALCSCALVQRAWTGPSQRVLFADVHVDDGNRDALFGVLQQARFTALIRTLTCCVPGIELHPRIVGGACLPALHTVVLAPVDGRLVLANLGELAELFRSLPALESLQLSYTRIVVQNGMHHGGAAVRLGAKELVVHSAEGIASDFRRVFDHVDLAALERLELSLTSTGDCLKVQTLLRRVPRLRELKAVLAGPSLDLKIEGMRACMGHWQHYTHTFSTLEFQLVPDRLALPFAISCAEGMSLVSVKTFVLRLSQPGPRLAVFDPFADVPHRARGWAVPDQYGCMLAGVSSFVVAFKNIAHVANASAFLALFVNVLGRDVLSVEWNGATSDSAIPSARRRRVGVPKEQHDTIVTMFETDADEEDTKGS